MNIIQQPEIFSLSGNLRKFIISSSTEVRFKLLLGGDELTSQSYSPDGTGRIEIDVEDIVSSYLFFSLSHESVYEQTKLVRLFKADIAGTEVSFSVIRAGVANLSDTAANWLKLNFLTWQPTLKDITYYSPEWISFFAVDACQLKLKAYFSDGGSKEIDLISATKGKAYTANVQYAHVCGLLGHKYPTHYDVYTEANGVRLSYIQRYAFSAPKSEEEEWFLFENSVGGIDTVRCSGDSDFTAEHTHNIAYNGEVEREYLVDTARKWNKDTGYLNGFERFWLLDFFPSKRKYIYTEAALRAIVVTESEAKHTESKLPSSYSFTFKLADAKPLLNLVRNENIVPETLVIPNVDSPDFIIPPRLAEYPRTFLGEGVLIPAIDPNSDKPSVTTFGAIRDTIIEAALASVPGAGEGGTMVNVIEEHSPTQASDKNVFSALRTLVEIKQALLGSGKNFLSKTDDDTAEGLITFLQGLKIGDKNHNWNIDKDGNGFLESLRLNSFLEVPELRYNRTQVVGGELYATNGGIIQDVTDNGDGTYDLLLKIEEGDHVPLIIDDILIGNYLAPNGWFSSYMRVIAVNDGAHTIKVVLGSDEEVPGGKNFAPVRFMNLAQRGNFTVKERQHVIRISSKDGTQELLVGIDNYKISKKNLATGIGLAKNFPFPDNAPVNPEDGAAYIRTLLVQDIIRINYEGKQVKDAIDRGLWEKNPEFPYRSTSKEQHDVWHKSCKWRCIVDNTSEEPKYNSKAWVMISGDPNLYCEMYSTEGVVFRISDVDTILSFKVFRGVEDITHTIADNDIEWSRDSGQADSDTLWNNAHASVVNDLHITTADMGNNWRTKRKVTFRVKAFVRDGDLIEKTGGEVNYTI